ncbi:hypothetical protein MO867_20945 [Microbulbifer sp. OS29]|uniref:Uncharacterized protein n=1 Tax=Microbulbifer okhotskensis TaxID=2926617 RepID=A0A9X2EWU2_9GAMM|nr:hypothetical protein [Microbulbifer okhotskensis]MCO1336798.1 hypothetical protein [Microbulbifer okhotskensis]
METKTELPEPRNPIVFNLLFTAAAAAAIVIALVDSSKATDAVNARACKSALMLLATRPSSVEIIDVSSIRGEMTREEGFEWAKARDVPERGLKRIEEFIDGSPMQRSFVTIDYAASESLIGDYRTKFLCGFVTNVFGGEIFDTITHQNKDYLYKDIFQYGRKEPEGVNLVNQVEHSNITDRLVYLMSLATSP